MPPHLFTDIKGYIHSVHPSIHLLHAVHSETTVAKIQYVNVVRHGCDVIFTNN